MKRQKVHDRDQYMPLDNSNDIDLSLQRPRIRSDNTIEAQIQEGDTLQAIALRFGCTVAELKRINKMERDFELHARKVIKVPKTPFSVLLDASSSFPEVHSSGNTTPVTVKEPVSRANSKELEEKLLIASVSAGGPNQQGNTEEPILFGEYDDSLPQPRVIRASHKADFTCNGSDCDISWICLLICILALCFIIPLIYVLYIAETHHPLNETHESIQNHVH